MVKNERLHWPPATGCRERRRGIKLQASLSRFIKDSQCLFRSPGSGSRMTHTSSCCCSALPSTHHFLRQTSARWHLNQTKPNQTEPSIHVASTPVACQDTTTKRTAVRNSRAISRKAESKLTADCTANSRSRTTEDVHHNAVKIYNEHRYTAQWRVLEHTATCQPSRGKPSCSMRARYARQRRKVPLAVHFEFEWAWACSHLAFLFIRHRSFAKERVFRYCWWLGQYPLLDGRENLRVPNTRRFQYKVIHLT